MLPPGNWVLPENTASSQCPQGLAKEAWRNVVEQRRSREGRKEKEGWEARRRKGRQEGKVREKKTRKEGKKEISANSQQHTSAGMYGQQQSPSPPASSSGAHLGFTAASLQPAASALCPSTSASFLLMASRYFLTNQAWALA